MKKQILKAFMMFVVIMMMAFVTAVVSANAQSKGQTLSANVPFDFMVGDADSERALEREMSASQDLASMVKQETVTVIASLR